MAGMSALCRDMEHPKEGRVGDERCLATWGRGGAREAGWELLEEGRGLLGCAASSPRALCGLASRGTRGFLGGGFLSTHVIALADHGRMRGRGLLEDPAWLVGCADLGRRDAASAGGGGGGGGAGGGTVFRGEFFSWTGAPQSGVSMVITARRTASTRDSVFGHLPPSQKSQLLVIVSGKQLLVIVS